MKIINEQLKDSKTIVFLDFEATETTREIISIGAIKADLDNKKQIKKTYEGFRCYVKTNTHITPIIRKITGLNDEILKRDGISFEKAINKLHRYVGNDLTFVHFLTYGNFDIRLLHDTAEKHNLLQNTLVLRIFHKNLDFSNFLFQYARKENRQYLSLVNALQLFKITPVEPLHDSLSDATNLMLLYKAFLNKRNILKEEYLKVITTNPHLDNPIKKLLKDILKDGVTNKENFLKYIEEELK